MTLHCWYVTRQKKKITSTFLGLTRAHQLCTPRGRLYLILGTESLISTLVYILPATNRSSANNSILIVRLKSN